MRRVSNEREVLESMFKHGQRAAVYKCLDCEIELSVPPNMVERVQSGQVRCNNPRCPGQRKGGGKYRRK